MKVDIKVLDQRAVIPKKASAGAARYDLTCFSPSFNKSTGIITYRTGLAFEVPRGYEIEIVPRSSTFEKHGLMLVNSVGVIDSDYRGEVLVMFYSMNHRITADVEPVRLVQMKVQRVGASCYFNDVEELSETSRGEHGFGSTGL